MNRSICLLLVTTIGLRLVAVAPGQDLPVITLEAEQTLGKPAKVYRDRRAAGGKSAVLLLRDQSGPVVEISRNLPPGDYLVTAWLEVRPVELLHGLNVQLTAEGVTRGLGVIQFDPRPGYQPFRMRFVHRGGAASIRLQAAATSGFDGLRHDKSEEEQKFFKELQPDDTNLLEEKPADDLGDDLELEADPDLAKLKYDQWRIACDRIEIRPLRQPRVLVASVGVDKVHYAPGETVKAIAQLDGGAAGGPYRLVAELVNEVDQARPVFQKDVTLEAGKSVALPFEFPLEGPTEFGHELRVKLMQGDQEAHSNSEFFGVSANVYRIGITGDHGGHSKQALTPERIVQVMERNKANYANYFEVFAWAPCDYSDMTPDTELFWSGQTQYPGSLSKFQLLLAEAHRRGIKGITYGKACGGGISGCRTFQRYPDFFGHNPGHGTSSEAFSTFYLERMLHNEYQIDAGPDIPSGWQHWASFWVNMGNPDAVDYGADEAVRSSRLIGWDGIRWDGHFVGQMARFKDRVKPELPNYAHGYNIAFANPGSPLFLPSEPVDDFHECAKDHGLMMDESVRDWSHTNWSSGLMRPFYEAICREGDYMKRIGGLPLFITFDMASTQDRTLNVLWGLAAGERYTYLTSPGDFAFGSLPRFLTRFSAFVWDDTALVQQPDRFIAVTPEKPAGQAESAGAPAPAAPWWQWSTWLRKLPDGRQQLLIHLVNPPGYPAFCNRVQTPPATLRHLQISVATPAGAKLVRAFHVSPDLVEGLVPLPARAQGERQEVTLPELRIWSIVAFEYAPAGDQALTYPAFELTTPVEDAAKVMAEEAKKKEIAAQQEAQKVQAGLAANAPKPEPKTPSHLDFEHHQNIDLDTEAKLEKPSDLSLRRNGMLDVLDVRGIFAWLNPVENAVGLVGGGHVQPAYVDRVGFRLGPDGDLEGFADQYDELLGFDVVVLDNVHAIDIGARRRAMMADFVRNGGGLLVFGGYFNLSLGADHNTYIGEVLPVRIAKTYNLARNDQGMTLGAAKPEFFPAGIDWATAQAFSVDISPLKDGVEVLARAGDHPAIVAGTYGKGRVIAVLINPHGDYPETASPYWLWPGWPRVLGACVQWLGQDYQAVSKPKAAKQVDPNQPTPEELLIEADMLDAEKFSKQLRAAVVNVVDTDSAQALLQTAIEGADKIDNPDLLSNVMDAVSPYVDDSFAPLADQLLGSKLDFLRAAGCKLLRLAGNPAYRVRLQNSLSDPEPDVVRESLMALGKIGDPASVPAIQAYLRQGSERLLALTALKQLGDTASFQDALKEYLRGYKKVIALTCARKSAYEDLYGGVAFKLTPAARRAAMHRLRLLRHREKQAIADLNHYRQVFSTLSDAELAETSRFLAESDEPVVASLAYNILPRLSDAQAQQFRTAMAQAKLPELKMLAAK